MTETKTTYRVDFQKIKGGKWETVASFATFSEAAHRVDVAKFNQEAYAAKISEVELPEAEIKEKTMRLHFHMNGTGSPQIHKAGCRDLDAMAKREGHEFEAATKEEVVRYIYGDHMQEHLDEYGDEHFENFLEDVHFKPCTKELK